MSVVAPPPAANTYAVRLLIAGLLFCALGAVETAVLRVVFGSRPVFVHVRWAPGVDATARQQLEQRYSLSRPELKDGRTWGYSLLDQSTGNIRALVGDAAVEDTHYIHRTAFRPWRFAPRRPYPTPLPWIPNSLELSAIVSFVVGAIGLVLALAQKAAPWIIRGPVLAARSMYLDAVVRAAWVWIPTVALLGGIVFGFDELLHLETLSVVVAGVALLVAARAMTASHRRNAAIVTLLVLGASAMAFTFDRSAVNMGDSEEHAQSRSNFERHFARQIRYEKHLTHVVLRQLYLRLDQTEEAPTRAIVIMARAAALWFIVSAGLIGFLHQWSSTVMRYLALAVLAPATLLYFGWWEFGYLALNLATFPLLWYGLRDGDARLEAASMFAGFGAALHGFGLLSIVGAWCAALTMRAPIKERLGRVLRIAAWATAAYVGWLAIYAIVLNAPIDPGPAGNVPWRPWFVGEVRDHRFAAPMFSAIAGRDLFMSGWVIGAPLLAVAASLWRRYPSEARAILAYSLPCIVFGIFRWPVQGLGRGIDLVVAAFPALYAVAWLCAHDWKRTMVAAALLVSAHIAFWHIVLDPQFVNQLVP